MHSVALRTQFRIEPRGRTLHRRGAARLVDLFGEPARWGETLNPLQLATSAPTVAGFTDEITATVTVPLTYDLDIAATKLLPRRWPTGEIPLLLLFSGHRVLRRATAACRSGSVPWHEEATFRLPVATWRAAMDEHYPGSGLDPAVARRHPGRACRRLPLAKHACIPHLGRHRRAAAEGSRE